jgi:hypothetical protein
MNLQIQDVVKSLRVRAGLAFVLAMASPLSMIPLISIDPFAAYRPSQDWEFFPGLFLVLSLLLVVVLSVALPWSQYQVSRSAWIQTLGVLVVLAMSLWGSAWCYRTHVCMAGHGCHGITYFVGRIVDICWVLGLVAGSTWGAFARMPISVPAAYISGFVISYRFLFGSMGGMYPFPI